MRRPSNVHKDTKAPNNRLSVAVKAQQRSSPRGPSGDRNRPLKAKERRESKEVKESAAKSRDDKVSGGGLILTRGIQI